MTLYVDVNQIVLYLDLAASISVDPSQHLDVELVRTVSLEGVPHRVSLDGIRGFPELKKHEVEVIAITVVLVDQLLNRVKVIHC